MIELKDIHKSFGTLEVLRGITMSVAKGEVVSIVGASGAGKSTLLHIMGTLSKPDSGTYTMDDVRLDTMSENNLASVRNSKIGFVFQFHHLLPEFNALENICIPALIGGTPKAQAEAHAKELASLLAIDHRLDHKPSQMSGGEQQRVAIARALINSPAVLLADEPTGNLDSKNRDEIHNLLFTLRRELGQTIVVVTHDASLTTMTDRAIIMKDGQIINE